MELPQKKYLTIGEVAEVCDLKPHVLRYWEQVFVQLKPMKRSGRRYYQQNDVILVLKIRELLYDKGYTISGAKTQLKHKPDETPHTEEPNPLILSEKAQRIEHIRNKIQAYRRQIQESFD